MFITTKLATAAVTGVLSLAVTSAAAFAAFQPDTRPMLTSAVEGASTTVQAEREGNGKGKDRIKEVLDKLVAKGVITQAQEDAIVAAFKEAAGDRDEHGLKLALGDLMKISADYLGLTKDDLMAQMKAGKSLGEIANATAGKSREGLITFDTAHVIAQLDKAVADGKITQERADEMKTHLLEHVTKFVDHKFEHKPPQSDRSETKGRGERGHAKPSASPKPTT